MAIRVVVADDSPFVCFLLTKYLESDPGIRVIKQALNGKEAVDFVRTWKPDVLTLDINMPVINGISALKTIMAECPTPVVLISGVSRKSARMTGAGLSLGAVDFVLKYSPDAAVSPDTLRREIIAKVRAAARIKVIRSIPSIDTRFGRVITTDNRQPATGNRQPTINNGQQITDHGPGRILKLVIIGASTGGPLGLKTLLSAMGESDKFRKYPFPVVIVQHMPEGFTGILASQFDRILPFPVQEAKEGDKLSPGTVLIAPGDQHLLFRTDGSVHISDAPVVNGQRPSIDVTMQSAAQVFGFHVTGVILSGMGNDGTQGLLAIKNNCGNTYAQSPGTCVIETMPASAIEKGVVERIGSPDEIGRLIC